MVIRDDMIYFRIADTTRLVLDSAASLRPSGGGTLSLGSLTNYYLGIYGYSGYFQNMRVGSLGGSGTMMVITDNDGDLSTQAIPDVTDVISGERLPNVLFTASSDSTFSSGYPINLSTLTNSQYEGNADGTRMFRIFLTGEFGADGGTPVLYVTVYLGSTMLGISQISNPGDPDCDFRIEIYISAISTTQSKLSFIMAGGKLAANDDYKDGFFYHPALVTHGTDNGLRVKMQSSGGTTNHYVKLIHAFVEVIEV